MVKKSWDSHNHNLHDLLSKIFNCILQFRVSSLKNRVPSLKIRVPSLKNRVPSLKTRVSSLKNRVPSLKNRVSSLKTRVSSLKNRVPSLKTRVSSLKIRERLSIFTYLFTTLFVCFRQTCGGSKQQT
jgi:chromosome segregation ATPase